MTEHATSLGHRAGDRWSFDEEVTHVFDDMLERSIPQYETMRWLVHQVGRGFVRPGTQVVDLGCSHGAALARSSPSSVRPRRTSGSRSPPPMLEAARTRFRNELEAGTVDLLDLDLRGPYPAVEASLTLSVLTLQFTPIEHRPRIVRDVYRHTVEGGAFVLVEKILGGSARVDGLFNELHHDLKRASGYSQEEIDRKRLSLEGVLVPVAAAWNEDLLRGAGFREVECFWRCLNFAAWVAVKDGA